MNCELPEKMQNPKQIVKWLQFSKSVTTVKCQVQLLSKEGSSVDKRKEAKEKEKLTKLPKNWNPGTEERSAASTLSTSCGWTQSPSPSATPSPSTTPSPSQSTFYRLYNFCHFHHYICYNIFISIQKKMVATRLLIYRLFWHSMRVLFLLQWEFFLQWKWPLSLQTTKNLFSQMNSFSRPQSVSVTGTLATAPACRRRRCWRRTPTRSSTSRRSSGRWTASPRSRNRRQSLALVASTPCSCPPWLWFWYSFSFTDWP